MTFRFLIFSKSLSFEIIDKFLVIAVAAMMASGSFSLYFFLKSIHFSIIVSSKL